MNLWELYKENKFDEAVGTGLKFLSDNKVADALHVIGLGLLHQKKFVGAEQLLNSASLLCPIKEWFINAASVSIDNGNTILASSFLNKGLEKHPNDIALLKLKAHTHLLNKEFHEAIAIDKIVLEKEYSNEVLLNLASAYIDAAMPTESYYNFDLILKNNPETNLKYLAMLGKARCAMDLGKFDEAEELFTIVFDAHFQFDKLVEYTYLYGLLKLTKGDLAVGWSFYQHRWWGMELYKTYETYMSKHEVFPIIAQTKKKVLLFREQGLGDVIQFIRFLPELQKHYTVDVKVPECLVAILSKAYPNTNFVTEANVDDYDETIGMMDLPYMLGINTFEQIPNQPYLFSDQKKTTKDLRVGVCCTGNPVQASDTKRSIEQEKFKYILNVPNVTFISLHINNPIEGIENPLIGKTDFMDTANEISQLDLIITVDTSVAHLAGAMGKPVWLLNRYDTCWRWLLNREDSPWYPSMKIFRQYERGNWIPVLEEVKVELMNLSMLKGDVQDLLFMKIFNAIGTHKPLKALEYADELLKTDDGKHIKYKLARMAKGRAYYDMGKLDEAEEILKDYVGEIPDYDLLFGLLKLKKGEKIGWTYQRRRFYEKFQRMGLPLIENLNDIKDSTVLFYYEQGRGDVLQFIRFLPDISRHAKFVYCLVPTSQLRLFELSFNYLENVKFLTHVELQEIKSQCDCEASLMDMPYLLDLDFSDIDGTAYLLTGQPSTIEDKLKVGICWAGNSNYELGTGAYFLDKRRSLTYEQIKPLLDVPGIEFVSLQMGTVVPGMDNPIHDDFDYLDTAKVIDSLDLVIAVDTSVAHLAAAMGKPTWLLSRYDACWRWKASGDTTEWYDSMTIYRQPPPLEGEAYSKDWESVIDQVKQDLIAEIPKHELMQTLRKQITVEIDKEIILKLSKIAEEKQ